MLWFCFQIIFCFYLHEFEETELSINDKTRIKLHHTAQNIAKNDHYIPLPCYLDMPQSVHESYFRNILET